MIANIIVVEDVSTFFKDLIAEGINAHPDEDFSQYVNSETQESTFTAEEAEVRNHLMAISFNVCEKAGIDIYDLMQEIYLKGTGLDQFIPLPSQKEFD
ncbi:hypothetical protein [Mucilaginibacter sp.]